MIQQTPAAPVQRALRSFALPATLAVGALVICACSAGEAHSKATDEGVVAEAANAAASTNPGSTSSRSSELRAAAQQTSSAATASVSPPAAPVAAATFETPGQPASASAVESPASAHDHVDAAQDHQHEDAPAASRTLQDLPKNGKLEVDASDHDFGTAVEGEVLRHTFAMKSIGEEDLVITTARPTCGCTVSKLEIKDQAGNWTLYNFGDHVPPGTDMQLTAELDTKNKKNVAQSKINIFCNDPRGTVTIGLKAVLDTYFNVAPAAIDFGEISVADTAEQTFEVTGKHPGPFKLEVESKPLPDGFKIDLQAIDPDADGKAARWKCKVTLGPNAREGNLGVPVTLMSSESIAGAKEGPDGSIPHYGVTVMTTGRVRGLISLEPQYLSFGLVRPGQVVSRTFTVKSFDPNFTFGANLKSSFAGPNEAAPEFKWAEHFSTTTKPSADGKGVDVEITLNGMPESADTSFQGRVILETGHPARPTVAVLFSGVCRSGVPTPAGGK